MRRVKEKICLKNKEQERSYGHRPYQCAPARHGAALAASAMENGKSSFLMEIWQRPAGRSFGRIDVHMQSQRRIPVRESGTAPAVIEAEPSTRGHSGAGRNPVAAPPDSRGASDRCLRISRPDQTPHDWTTRFARPFGAGLRRNDEPSAARRHLIRFAPANRRAHLACSTRNS